MGLDITAYSAIIPTSDPDAGYHVWDGGFTDRCAPFTKGYYVGALGAEKHRFHAGSYSGYSYWRSTLSMLVNNQSSERFWALPPDQRTGPFADHINFTDCDGSIGSISAAKLAKDYAEWQERIETACSAMKSREDAEYFLMLYAEWRRAFEIAAGNGVVIFH